MNSSLSNLELEGFGIVSVLISSLSDSRDSPEHGHIAAIVNKEARHLIQLAGSPELAKRAIDVISESEERMRSAMNEELAKDLGYLSVSQMMKQTEVISLPNGSHVHLTTDSDGFWVAWSDKPYYDFQRFESRKQALSSLREDENPLILRS